MVVNLEINSRSAGLQAPDQAELESSTATSSAHRFNQLRSSSAEVLTSMRGFQRLTSEQQNQALKIFEALNQNDNAPAKNAQILNKLILADTPNHTQKLIDTSYKGESLLAVLAHLAEAKDGNSAMRGNGVKPEAVLASVINDISDVAGIEQGKKSTCPVCSAQWFFARHSAAQYAGQISEVVITGVVRDQANDNAILKIPAYIPKDERSISSSLYQTMCMQAVDGGYDAYTDTVMGKVGPHPGLYSRQLELLMERITGKAMLRVDSANSSPQHILSHIDRSTNNNQPTLIIAALTGIGTGEHLLHDVNITERKNGQVYFRNPWGNEFIASGKDFEVVDAHNGIYRMSEEAFLRNCQYMVVQNPDQSLASYGETAGALDEVGGYSGPQRTVPFVTNGISVNVSIGKIKSPVSIRKANADPDADRVKQAAVLEEIERSGFAKMQRRQQENVEAPVYKAREVHSMPIDKQSDAATAVWVERAKDKEQV